MFLTVYNRVMPIEYYVIEMYIYKHNNKINIVKNHARKIIGYLMKEINYYDGVKFGCN